MPLHVRGLYNVHGRAAGGVEAAVLARLHHVALPLWTVPADSAPAPLLSKLLSSLLSSPLVGLYLLIQRKRTRLVLQMFNAAS